MIVKDIGEEIGSESRDGLRERSGDRLRQKVGDGVWDRSRDSVREGKRYR